MIELNIIAKTIALGTVKRSACWVEISADNILKYLTYFFPAADFAQSGIV